ncbi:excinuclease ABC subunit UvrC [Legionella israelensis]|uniref:excinuclease ABC subunit UvrC n=1 Tax=Legionella israelensis TaxID=454 RepID=UPI0011802EE2|nr:excinuclease ABC subunit UvrC [Legionella israelensis]QDP71867.1 excinuclease ABC subunit UvrC [Legionella israelensis]
MKKQTVDLNRFIRGLTTEPGVYRMLNAEDVVLYVGKASNLKKRVNSYFTQKNQSAKTRSLMKQVMRIEVSVTRSETEALLLESSLIKHLRPKYNVLLRDDKSYPYIRVTDHPEFPRMEIFRSKKKPLKGRFFGPYPNVLAVRDTLNTIQKVFKIRNCSDSYFNARSRPCLQYQIKRCTAPCVDFISPKDYQQSVNDAIRFLQGKSQLIIHELERRMEKAVKQLAFEEAARLRDQIKSLRAVQEQQGVVHVRGDADVIAIAVRNGLACVQCVTIREGQVTASQSFFPKLPKTMGEAQMDEEENDLWQQTFAAFIGFYYLHMPERIPATIITQRKVSDQKALEAALSSQRGSLCSIQFRPRGVKKRWLDFAEDNLRLAFSEHLSSSSSLESRYRELEQLLNLSRPITWMECFDISHTSGKATVASCVVFDRHGPARSRYRRFNISGITAGDDYAAMGQAIHRRFKRLLSEQSLPDVLIIDGGKGQVEVAHRVLNGLGIHEVKIIGIAKGPSRKAGWERLILLDEDKEKVLAEDSSALHLLQHIRDEAHRFAITAHRKKRLKTGFESSLESIEGVGARRRQALLHRFGGIKELSRASLEEIEKVDGISKVLAEKIYRHFHSF